MPFSGDSVLVILVVGLIAGWLAAKILEGGGFGLIGDIIVGVIGAFVAAGCCRGWESGSEWGPSERSSTRPSGR